MGSSVLAGADLTGLAGLDNLRSCGECCLLVVIRDSSANQAFDRLADLVLFISAVS